MERAHDEEREQERQNRNALEARLQESETQIKEKNRIIRNERQTVSRMKTAKEHLKACLDATEAPSRLADVRTNQLPKALAAAADEAEKSKLAQIEIAELSTRHQSLLLARKNSRDSHKTTVKNLNKKLVRFSTLLEKAASSSSTQPFELKKKGVLTSQAKALARNLVQSGCSQEHINSVIEAVGHAMGKQVKDGISRRSVGRALTEIGVAWVMQAGYEITLADSESSSSSLSNVTISVRRFHSELRRYLPQKSSVRVTKLGTDCTRLQRSEKCDYVDRAFYLISICVAFCVPHKRRAARRHEREFQDDSRYLQQ